MAVQTAELKISGKLHLCASLDSIHLFANSNMVAVTNTDSGKNQNGSVLG